MKLTDKLVANISEPGTYWDADKRSPTGFGLRVYGTGSKSLFLNYWLNGRERRHTIGAFPDWSVTAGREEAKELRQRIDRGEDPAGERRERREAPTVQDLIDRYIADHLPRKSANPMRRNDEKSMLVLIAERIGKHTKVGDVHSGDIAEMHLWITENRGPVRANRVLATASKLFALSLMPLAGENTSWRSAALGNPCKGIERNHEEARDRFFSQAELAAIGEALNKYDGVAADCVRLIMLTGCRPAEAMKATWQEFDAEPGLWIKPSAHTKQRKAHRLPLNPPAIELINKLRKKRREGVKWVFPSSKQPGQHLVALWHIWEFIRKETGIGNTARLYDLRHTFASTGAGGGLSLPIIGKLLGHTQARTTQRYAHLADDPLREATEKIGRAITEAGKPGADVVSIKR
jgi:integrase